MKVPSRIRNSPTNPFSIGSPMLENITTPKQAAKTGIGFATPPKSAIILVWRRS